MKTFVSAYSACNLGDDLFIKILSERYQNQFTLLSSRGVSGLNNVKTIKFYKKLDRLVKLLTFKKLSISDLIVKKDDLIVFIGGSMFMENKNKFPKKHILDNKNNYVVLGSNFGPYFSEKYFNKFKNIFEKAKDVCFRDSYSYNLFKDNKKVRYTSDIVFSLKVKPNNKAKKNALISVIDCDKKMGSEYTSQYENKIIELINFLKGKGYTINLMSFCKGEGDEDAINRILSKVDNENVNTILYSGDINDALNSMNNCDLIIGSRFHANILGLVMNKTVIPVAYSDKTINVLKDIGFKGKYFDIRDMDNFDINSISDSDLTYKCDVSDEKKKAEEHFTVLDTILNRRG